MTARATHPHHGNHPFTAEASPLRHTAFHSRRANGVTVTARNAAMSQKSPLLNGQRQFQSFPGIVPQFSVTGAMVFTSSSVSSFPPATQQTSGIPTSVTASRR